MRDFLFYVLGLFVCSVIWIHAYKRKHPYPEYRAIVEKKLMPSWNWTLEDTQVTYYQSNNDDEGCYLQLLICYGPDILHRKVRVSKFFLQAMNIGDTVRVQDKFGDFELMWSKP